MSRSNDSSSGEIRSGMTSNAGRAVSGSMGLTGLPIISEMASSVIERKVSSREVPRLPLLFIVLKSLYCSECTMITSSPVRRNGVVKV